MPASFARFLVALALLTLASPARAQDGKRYALLVGITEYDSASFSTLKYSENDAEVLAKVLKDSGYHEVIVLTTSRGKKDKKVAPTAENIRSALQRLSNQVKRNDLLLVGLSGHGVLWPVEKTTKKKKEKEKGEKDESFFCPQDARPRSEATLVELKKTMIPMGELFATLDESGAGVRLLLVDACRNEVKGSGRNIDIDHLPRTKKGTAVLFSCKAGERAFETQKLKHGVFFHHVITGLNTGKAEDKNGVITWGSLVDYVVEQVTKDVPTVIGDGARQTPHEIKNIEGVSPVLLPQAKGGPEAAKLFREGMDIYSQALIKPVDPERTVKPIRQAAHKGHMLSWGYIGMWTYHGRLQVEKDEAEGLRLIRKALPAVREEAGRGNVDAQMLLGELLMRGIAMAKDEKKAAEWLTKANDKGSLAAAFHLAWMYESGVGVTTDQKKAIELYTKIAAKGSVQVMIILGVKYATGSGVAKDGKKAFEWYTKAANTGEPVGFANLAALYEEGLGVTKDDKKAIELYTTAADKGNVPSMARLAWKFENGNGVPKDISKALMWYKKAAALRHPESQGAVERLEPKK